MKMHNPKLNGCNPRMLWKIDVLVGVWKKTFGRFLQKLNKLRSESEVLKKKEVKQKKVIEVW